MSLSNAAIGDMDDGGKAALNQLSFISCSFQVVESCPRSVGASLPND